jgi:hypothetical protein
VKNTIRSLAAGFGLLWKNFESHLEYGLEAWLFGPLQEKNISPPASWTDPKALFFFALEVMGLSVEHLFELLKQRFPPEKVDGLRQWYGRISRVADWINRTIDVNKTPAQNTAGLIEQAKDFGKSILTDIATWVTTKVIEEVALLATAAAASAGLSEVIDVARRIYKALVSAKRWARQLLDMAKNTLDNINDIATGAVDKVGKKFEDILHKGMPVVIGFLADQVGLGGIDVAVQSAVDKLRGYVDRAILWLIDKVKAALDGVVNLVKAGVTAVAEWWHQRRDFDVEGEPHAVYLSGSEGNPQIIVASRPVTWDAFVGGLGSFPSPAGTGALATAQAAARTLSVTMRRPAASFVPPATKADQVAQDLNQLALALGPLIRLSFPGTNLYPGSNLDPRARTVAELWNDIRPDVIPGYTESPRDIEFRRVMARGRLLDQYQPNRRATAQAMIDHNLGRILKGFELVANEALSTDAHTVRDHVLNGSGQIKNNQDLALRVLLDKPTTGGNPASAFRSVTNADQAIRAGINVHMGGVANWPVFRERIVANGGNNNPIQPDVAGGAAGRMLAASVGTPVPIPQLPAYLSGYTYGVGGNATVLTGASGTNPLYPGDPNAGLTGPPLTNDVAVSGNLRIVMRTQPQPIEGGWFVLTAFPV